MATNNDNVNDLPAGWVKYIDKATGDPYYHNAELNETTWDHPGRWKVGLFFDSLREKAAQRSSSEGGSSPHPMDGVKPASRLQRLLGRSDGRKGASSEAARDEAYNWSAEPGEDDLALRRRLTERIEYLRSAFAKGDDAGQIGELRDELGRRRDRLDRLREALDAEKRKAAELVVAAGGEGPRAESAWSARRKSEDVDRREEEIRSLRLQVADLQQQVAEQAKDIDDDDDLEALDETMLDIDAAIKDAAVLAEAGVSSQLAYLLRTRPWDDEVMLAAVVEDVALEWQARDTRRAAASCSDHLNDDEDVVDGVVGLEGEEPKSLPQEFQFSKVDETSPQWRSPLEVPDLLAPDTDSKNDRNGVAIPVALRRVGKPLNFPKTKQFLTGRRNDSLFTDASASTRYESLERAATLPGTCWRWLCGWRFEGGGEGWVYGDIRSLALLVCSDTDAPILGDDSHYGTRQHQAPVRCRRWRRMRALVEPPPDPKLQGERTVCIVARKLLELRAHAASLEILASKLSEQLVSTRAALDMSERKAARLPALEAALVETSSMLRDTELRRDALQRQIMNSASLRVHEDREICEVMRGPSDDGENFFQDHMIHAPTNNPFLDDVGGSGEGEDDSSALSESTGNADGAANDTPSQETPIDKGEGESNESKVTDCNHPNRQDQNLASDNDEEETVEL